MADEQFYTILTNKGKAKIANATLLNSNVTLTTLKVGDGNGAYYNPTEEQTDLKNVVHTCQVGSISIDKKNPNWVVVETIIPGSVGGFIIREIGLFDTEGDMIAVGKYPETYKPVVANGASKDLNVRTIFEVSNAENVTLNINPSVIIATKEDINNLQEQITDNATQLNDIVKYPKMQYTSNITTTILKSVSGGSANWTSPQWNLKKYDTNYFIENDNTLITIKQSGLYIINLAINLNVSNGANFSIKLIKNYGDTGVEEIAYENKLATSVSTRINLCTTCYINQNETLKALIYHEGQSDVNLVCGYGFPMISVTKVGEMG